MPSEEKSIVINLIKIINWSSEACVFKFNFSFYSIKTSTFLLGKQIKGILDKNVVYFNYPLKIAYTSTERQILLIISTISQTKKLQQLGQIEIDLQNLQNNKNKFYPFGLNSQVLKIICQQNCDQPLQLYQKKQQSLNGFLQQRQNFIARTITPMYDTLRQSISKKVFRKAVSERAYRLLGERPRGADSKVSFESTEDLEGYYGKNIPREEENIKSFRRAASQKNLFRLGNLAESRESERLSKNIGQMDRFRTKPKIRESMNNEYYNQCQINNKNRESRYKFGSFNSVLNRYKN